MKTPKIIKSRAPLIRSLASGASVMAMMIVQTYFANGAVNPAVVPSNPLPDEQVRGHGKSLMSVQLVANGDSATSTITFGTVPANARLKKISRIDADAIAGNTSFSLGDATFPTALMNAADIHAGGTFNVTIANGSLGQPLWQLLGYAADPLREITIIGTLGANLAAGGNIALTLDWADIM